jgi:hypothetical protein
MTYLFTNNQEIANDIGNALPIVGNVNATVYNGSGLVTQTNPLHVSLGSNSITVIGNTNIIDTVTVSSTPETPVHVHLTEIGTSGNLQVPYMPIQGNVNATISNIITVIAEEQAGNLFSINNHAINTNRGWTMDDTMRPVISFRVSNTRPISELTEIVGTDV